MSSASINSISLSTTNVIVFHLTASQIDNDRSKSKLGTFFSFVPHTGRSCSLVFFFIKKRQASVSLVCCPSFEERDICVPTFEEEKEKKNQRTIAIDLEEGRPICALYVYAPSVTLASRSFSIPRAPYCRAHTPRLAAAIVSSVVCNVAQLAGRLQKRPTGDANECGRNSFTRHQSTFSPYYATIHHLLLLQLLMVD